MKGKNKTSLRKKTVIALITIFSFSSVAISANKPDSKYGGVQLGTITYSYRSMEDQSLPAIIDYSAQSGLSSIELMGSTLEIYIGRPESKNPEVLKKWRTSVSLDKIKDIRKMFDKKGVKIHILKIGDSKWSDEEINYAFNACKILGAKGISMEISEEAAKRFQPFAEKHKLYVIFHNHGQPADPNFSFDKILDMGSMLMLNFDAGHFYGYTGKNPCDLIDRLHQRIVSVHLKDKTGPKDTIPNKNQPFGKGGTPVVEILQQIQKNKWEINCDIELEYVIPENSDAVKEVDKCREYCKKALSAGN